MANDCPSPRVDAVRRQLVRYRGVERDTAGDGLFARFGAPAAQSGTAVSIGPRIASAANWRAAGIAKKQSGLASGGGTDASASVPD